jgi:hypothetical protein
MAPPKPKVFEKKPEPPALIVELIQGLPYVVSAAASIAKSIKKPTMFEQLQDLVMNAIAEFFLNSSDNHFISGLKRDCAGPGCRVRRDRQRAQLQSDSTNRACQPQRGAHPQSM